MFFGRFSYRRAHYSSESGYVLLVLMLFVSLVLIATLATAPDLAQQIRRDREEEMIHRGTEYARAIKHFVKKIGRYPTSLEELENTNNMRFLRKRYADPMTKDGKWKLLHVGDVKLDGTPNFGQPVAQAFGQTGGQSPLGLGGPGGLSAATGPGGVTPAMGPGGLSSPSGPGGFGLSGGLGGSPQQGGPGGLTATPSPSDASGGSNPTAPGSNAPGGTPQGTSSSSSTGQTGSSPGGSSSSQLASGQQFGMGAVIGVASVSEKVGLREFNNKTHYNQWYFIYDPNQDRGGLLRGPYSTKQFGGTATAVGAPAAPATTPGAFGQQPGMFGQQPGGMGIQPGGFGQQPNSQPQMPPSPR